ncbi:hypothetical protein [Modicisalibacter luteus]|uniref:hypothetical protein n=1 Tax=Modicisalibacter luteus TaxID=453962 RepID=UPI00362DAA58
MYYTTLGFMEGHLSIAQDLYESGHALQGTPHLSHPLVEHYPAVDEALEARNQSGLEEALRALSDKAGQSDDWTQIEPVFKRAQEAIDAAQANVEPAKRNDPRFISDVTLALLKQASAEYEEAVEDDQFVNPTEYQDGRGFVLVAKELWQSNAEALKSADADAYQKSLEELDTLAKAWPAPQPPQAPAMSPNELHGEVSRFELATSAFR